MELFTVAAADRRFLKRWMRCHALVWLVIGSVLTISSVLPSKGGYQAPSQSSIRETVHPSESVAHAEDAHIPVGWRRTAFGWEHTSNWLAPDKSIDHWIEEQKSREPAWIQRALALIRNTPPLVFAVMQLSMITAVVLITTRKRLSL
jgi:hypothetical protein